ncbi:prephenate dehydrogenase [Nicoliella lavandulae]|uniref:Prephenate dehydrogenase/arogenate dehydrogenase family protein n=1 Tax=Nicoliella lavandulae TaxID=3082954 RepID=A0ABU8SNU9_9LACO
MFINGLGLIGASMAKIIKQTDPTVSITACDVNPQNLTLMKAAHVIDQAVDFTQGATNADVIILATPVKSIIKSLNQLAQLKLRPDVLVTDVGSNKTAIVDAAQPLVDRGIHFLGGHPMAGSHLSGSQHSSSQLLAAHTYFLVNVNASQQQISAFKGLIAAGQFNFQSLSAIDHDQLVSLTSHLPHALAFTLINMIDQKINAMGIDPGIPAGGLLDTTRVAKANPTMWASILTSEPQTITDQITDLQQQLEQLKTMIKAGDEQALKQMFTHANQIRNKMEDLT